MWFHMWKLHCCRWTWRAQVRLHYRCRLTRDMWTLFSFCSRLVPTCNCRTKTETQLFITRLLGSDSFLLTYYSTYHIFNCTSYDYSVLLGIRPVKIDWWGVGVVICLERGANCLHMVHLMPLPSQNPIISCLIYIQADFTFLVPAYPGCPGKEAIKRV